MKKALYPIAILAFLSVFLPIGTAQAQSYCSCGSNMPYQSYQPYQQYPTDMYVQYTYPNTSSNYNLGSDYSFYQYPIPWYTYFQTPNQTATNYYPTNYNYPVASAQPTQYPYQYSSQPYSSQPYNQYPTYSSNGYNGYSGFTMGSGNPYNSSYPGVSVLGSGNVFSIVGN